MADLHVNPGQLSMGRRAGCPAMAPTHEAHPAKIYPIGIIYPLLFTALEQCLKVCVCICVYVCECVCVCVYVCAAWTVKLIYPVREG